LARDLGFPRVARLDANESCFGPFPGAAVAAREAIAFAHRYPELGAALVARLAARHDVAAGAIALGNGADSLIGLISYAALAPGDEAVMPDPTFVSYAQDARRALATPVPVPVLPDGRLDVDAMTAAVCPATRLVWVCNPNNPTGGMTTREELERLLAEIPDDVLVVLDEAYAEYLDDPAYPDGAALTRERANIAVLRTFSKLFGLAGLRIGYVIGPPELVDAVNALRHWYDVSDVAMLAATASLDDPEEILRRRDLNRELREQMVAILDVAGLTPLPSCASYVFVPVDDADTLEAALRLHGVIVRPYPHARGSFVRIAVGEADDLHQLEAALYALQQRGALPGSGA
jgi:histidinol-phosphate aminotransferase